MDNKAVRNPRVYSGSIKVTVLGRHTMAQTVLPRHKHAVISIFDPGSPLPEIGVNRYTGGVLRLQFFDVDRDRGPQYRPIPNNEHARKILDFTEKALAANVKDLFVHCEAGVSRSSATAQAIKDVFRGIDFELSPVFHHPNRLLYNLIVNEARARVKGFHDF